MIANKFELWCGKWEFELSAVEEAKLRKVYDEQN